MDKSLTVSDVAEAALRAADALHRMGAPDAGGRWYELTFIADGQIPPTPIAMATLAQISSSPEHFYRLAVGAAVERHAWEARPRAEVMAWCVFRKVVKESSRLIAYWAMQDGFETRRPQRISSLYERDDDRVDGFGERVSELRRSHAAQDRVASPATFAGEHIGGPVAMGAASTEAEAAAPGDDTENLAHAPLANMGAKVQVIDASAIEQQWSNDDGRPRKTKRR